MKISSAVHSSDGQFLVTLTTNENSHNLTIPPKPSGFGCSVNGGELLFLALATCYCNDIYREAAKRGIRVKQVEVQAAGEFGAEGEPATNVTYRARVSAEATEAEIRDVMNHTDRVSEIQNTIRAGISVTLSSVEAVSL